MDELEYVTLYLPTGGLLCRHPGSRLLSDEAIAWLNENVGVGTLNSMEWFLGAEERQHEWCYAGLLYSPESDYTKVTKVIYFRDSKKALMFKLVWGGD